MGGRRGYGPTHSQTLDKFLVGIDNVTTIALNNLIDPGVIYKTILKENHPVIVIENKADYTKKIAKNQESELYIQDSKGKIRSKDSYGNDPCPPKDKEH